MCIALYTYTGAAGPKAFRVHFITRNKYLLKLMTWCQRLCQHSIISICGLNKLISTLASRHQSSIQSSNSIFWFRNLQYNASKSNSTFGFPCWRIHNSWMSALSALSGWLCPQQHTWSAVPASSAHLHITTTPCPPPPRPPSTGSQAPLATSKVLLRQAQRCSFSRPSSAALLNHVETPHLQMQTASEGGPLVGRGKEGRPGRWRVVSTNVLSRFFIDKNWTLV